MAIRDAGLAPQVRQALRWRAAHDDGGRAPKQRVVRLRCALALRDCNQRCTTLNTLNTLNTHSLFFHREMELSLIGLQNAGKSSLVQVLTTGSFQEDTIPTVGFNMRKVTKGSVTIKMWDLGGQPRFRSLWERYCRGVQAIVYVVDAADAGAVEAAARELHALLERPSLDGIPLLVLGNKNDLPGALGTQALIDRMELGVS